MSYTLSNTVEGRFDEIVDYTINALKREFWYNLYYKSKVHTKRKNLTSNLIKYKILGLCDLRSPYNWLFLYYL